MPQDQPNGSIVRSGMKRPVVYTNDKTLLGLSTSQETQEQALTPYTDYSHIQQVEQHVEDSRGQIQDVDFSVLPEYQQASLIEPTRPVSREVAKRSLEPTNLDLLQKAVSLSTKIANSGNTSITTINNHYYQTPTKQEPKATLRESGLPPVMECLLYFALILMFFFGATAVTILMFDRDVQNRQMEESLYESR